MDTSKYFQFTRKQPPKNKPKSSPLLKAKQAYLETFEDLERALQILNDPAKRVPPLHPNCRSILVPVDKDGLLVGQRPFVMDERKVKDIPKDELEKLIGQIDANTTFKEFFKKTDDFFQKEWLGPKRFKLYKEGKFDFDKFFDLEGQLYTLEHLRKLDGLKFKELGI